MHIKFKLSPLNRRGLTLIEISLVLALLLALSAIIGLSVEQLQNWRRGKNGGLILQAVYEAQRAYLADNPTRDVSAMGVTDLMDYMPRGWGRDAGIMSPVDLLTRYQIRGNNNEELLLDFARMPPVFLNGGTPYDPTGGTPEGRWDGQWDVSEPPALLTP